MVEAFVFLGGGWGIGALVVPVRGSLRRGTLCFDCPLQISNLCIPFCYVILQKTLFCCNPVLLCERSLDLESLPCCFLCMQLLQRAELRLKGSL